MLIGGYGILFPMICPPLRLFFSCLCCSSIYNSSRIVSGTSLWPSKAPTLFDTGGEALHMVLFPHWIHSTIGARGTCHRIVLHEVIDATLGGILSRSVLLRIELCVPLLKHPFREFAKLLARYWCYRAASRCEANKITLGPWVVEPYGKGSIADLLDLSGP